ncbi:MAG: metal-dependent hydrolase [Desulfovibrio sp.]|nr:metal-dependent hydrolase [Desulfovibrio sp.]
MSDITWYGHSAFKIATTGAQVLLDPFFPPSCGCSVKDVGAVDLVLVTHDHGDHVGSTVDICKTSGAKLGAIVGTAEKLARSGLPQGQILNGIGFNMGGTLEHKGVKVTMVPAWHSSESGTPAGYIVRMPDGLTVYHAGDTCVSSDMELWGKLYSIDVALLPVGGVFTMDAAQAALACTLLRCRHVIPMHWGTFPVLAQNTDDFRAALDRQGMRDIFVQLAPGQSAHFSPQKQP